MSASYSITYVGEETGCTMRLNVLRDSPFFLVVPFFGIFPYHLSAYLRQQRSPAESLSTEDLHKLRHILSSLSEIEGTAVSYQTLQ